MESSEAREQVAGRLRPRFTWCACFRFAESTRNGHVKVRMGESDFKANTGGLESRRYRNLVIIIPVDVFTDFSAGFFAVHRHFSFCACSTRRIDASSLCQFALVLGCRVTVTDGEQ